MLTLRSRRARGCFVVLALALGGCDPDDPAPAAPIAGIEVLSTLERQFLPEASGLAVSGRAENRYWFINDSGNDAVLVSLELPAREFRRTAVFEEQNRDWEDLEGFRYDDEPWLLIADVGDNRGVRDRIRLLLLPEPEVDSERVHVHTTIELTYPDAARDAEAVAVDAQARRIYLLSKRDRIPRLYSLPLPSLERPGSHRAVLRELGPVASIPPPTAQELRDNPRLGRYRSQPTAMSASPDGRFIALLTYRGVYRATLGGDRDWLRALNESLCSISPIDLEQAESIAIDARNRVVVSSEGRRAPLLRFDATCMETVY